MSRSEAQSLDSIISARPDLNRIFEQKVEAGFPPELALDLVLHELVVRAADATHASSAALALARGDEMVCRAATGISAPDLGIPLNTRDGLSGACLRTRQPQLCADTESDPRVDPVTARRLGIRSILIVPVLDADDLIGVLEVFSIKPSAFSEHEQTLLEAAARECARIRHAADLAAHPSARLALVPPDEEQSQAETLPPSFIGGPASPPTTQPLYEKWTLVVGTLAILATVAVSLMIGSRIRWLFSSSHSHSIQVQVPQSPPTAQKPATPSAVPVVKSAASRRESKATAQPPPAPNPDELVIYDHGKAVFRLSRATGKNPAALLPDEPAKAKIATLSNVWLAPDRAEARLTTRVEPQYPPDAIAGHRSGNVVLEVTVADDGSVASIRTLTGDPLLTAAAVDAVRQWRYEPYRENERPSSFQTDVTLTFSLPN